MTARREALLLVVACAVLYLTGAADIAFYTRGEPREGLVVREMLRTGDWLVPARPEGEPARKPPLYYWSAAPALAALPARAELALRLPSAVLGTAAVLGTWATARAAWGPPAGLPAALMLATAFEWTRAATAARVDMTLAAALTAVLAGWTLALVRRGRGWPALAAAGAALGTLAKGPVALVLPALAAAALVVAQGEIKPLRVLRVLGAAALVAGLWYAAAFAREGTAFLDVVARENWLRFVDTEEAGTGHSHSVVYLLPLGLVGLLPWTPLVPLALAPLASRPRAPAAMLAATWVATGFVFFSLAAAKRSVYLLPLYPAVALLLGAGVAALPAGRLARAARLGAALYAPAALILAALAAALALGLDPGAPLRPWLGLDDAAGAAALASAAHGAKPWLALLSCATVASVPLVARAARRAEWRSLVLAVATLFVAWTACFDALLHPAIARGRSLQSFFVAVARIAPPDAPIHALFPPDPGLRFYAPPSLKAWPAEGLPAGGYLLLWEDEWRRLRDGAGQPLPVLTVSEGRQARRGHLALVSVPPGPLAPAAKAPGSPAPPASGSLELRPDRRQPLAVAVVDGDGATLRSGWSLVRGPVGNPSVAVLQRDRNGGDLREDMTGRDREQARDVDLSGRDARRQVVARDARAALVLHAPELDEEGRLGGVGVLPARGAQDDRVEREPRLALGRSAGVGARTRDERGDEVVRVEPAREGRKRGERDEAGQQSTTHGPYLPIPG